MNKTLLFSAALLGLTGCASITKGTTQTLIFNLEPVEAKCSITRDGDGELGTITGRNNTITVGKDKDDIIVKCNAPAHASKTIRIASSAEAAGIVGGLFLDLGVVDMITGAMWSYPNATTVSLEKCGEGKQEC